MQLAPVLATENKRMKQVLALGILDTAPEPRFDAITREATERFKVPISTISIIDSDREWYKSCQGISVKQGDRSMSFCGHAMNAPIMMVVEDTLKDDRFMDNPAVVGAPFIRFYAGVALRERTTGLPVGVLCIKDTTPRHFSADETSDLIAMSQRAEDLLNMHA